MGRKPIEANEDAMAIAAMAKKQEETALSIQETDKQFLGEGETYNLYLCLEKARMYQEQMASGMLGLGAQLNLIKAHEEHGNFLSAVEQLGLAERSARYAMAASRKFGNRQTSADFGLLGKEKLRALTVLDDDSIQALSDGEEVARIGTLDDIEKMSVRDLKAALRKEKTDRKKERDAQEEVIAAKNNKLDEMERELRYQQPPTKEQLAQAALDAMRDKLCGPLLAAKTQLAQLRSALVSASRIPGVTGEQLDAWAAQYAEYQSALDDEYQQAVEDIQNLCPDKTEV